MWTLRPADLPGGRAAGHEPLRDLASNAIYRRLIHLARTRRGVRMRLHFLTLLGWLIVPWIYVRYLFPFTTVEAALASLPVSIGVMLLIGLLFMIGGIEGYESLRGVFRAPSEIVLSGLTGRDIAAGIWGRTVVFQRPRAVRAAAAVAILAETALVLGIGRADLSFLLQWLALAGVILGSMIFALAGGGDTLVLPGTLLWTRSIRRRYVARVAALEGVTAAGGGSGGGAGVIARAGRRMWEIGMELTLLLVIIVVLLPLGGYWLLGEWIEWQRNAPILFGAEVPLSAAFAAGGWFAGHLAVLRTRRTAGLNFDRLADELGLLFRLRAQWLAEGAGEG